MTRNECERVITYIDAITQETRAYGVWEYVHNEGWGDQITNARKDLAQAIRRTRALRRELPPELRYLMHPGDDRGCLCTHCGHSVNAHTVGGCVECNCSDFDY